jgi:hypothetical protein
LVPVPPMSIPIESGVTVGGITCAFFFAIKIFFVIISC